MKNWILSGVVLVLGIFMVGLSAWQVRAVEDVLGEQTVSEVTPEQAKQALLEQEVVYYLPYPGILPDHPVYWLKMLRDRIAEKLAPNTEKKIDLWILYADKRLGAAKVLVEGNKAQLGWMTATKAYGYMEKVVVEVEREKNEGKDVGEVANRLERGVLKHAQVLNGMAMVATGGEKDKLAGMRDEMLKLYARVLVILER